MRFALLGVDPHAIALARAVALSPQHELIKGCAIANPPGELRTAAPDRQWNEPWETLLAPDDVDGVIVARHDDARQWMERVGHLVRDGVPTLAVHPGCDLVSAWEVAALGDLHPDCLWPYTPGAGHPALTKLAAWCQGREPSRQTELLVFERRSSNRGGDALLRELADDIPLIRQVAGELTEISVLGPTVSLRGPSGLEVRWSALPRIDGAVSRLEAFAHDNSASLLIDEDTNEWQLVLPGDRPCVEPWNDPAEMIDRFSRAIRGQAESRSWAEAIVDLEYLESAKSSAARGQPVTRRPNPINDEASSFKASMSVGSCLLLATAIGVLLAWAAIEGIRLPLTGVATVLEEDRTNEGSTHVLLRLWPAYPLLAFLLLQGLLFLTRRPGQSNAKPGSSGKV